MNELIINGELHPRAIQKVIALAETIAQYESEYNSLKNAILNAMAEQNIVKIDTEEVLINYIAPTTRESLDSKRLKEELPNIYDEYARISPVKASLKVKIK